MYNSFLLIICINTINNAMIDSTEFKFGRVFKKLLEFV